MFSFHRNFFPLAPLVDPDAPANRNPQRLSGTGTTEAHTQRNLIMGKLHVLVVGSEPVRVRFSGTKITADAVDPNRDVVYPAGAVVPFVPDKYSMYVHVEAGDGTSDYEAFVMQYQS